MTPDPAQFVELRGRPRPVEAVDAALDCPATVRLSRIADEAQGELIDVTWDAELSLRIVDDDGWDSLGSNGTNSASTFAAHFRYIRWNTSTATYESAPGAAKRASARGGSHELT